MCQDRDLIDLAREVAATCYSRRQEAKAMKTMMGTEPDHWEMLRYLNGSKLIQDIAKRKKWDVIFHGAPARGYTCEIREL